MQMKKKLQALSTPQGEEVWVFVEPTVVKL